MAHTFLELIDYFLMMCYTLIGRRTVLTYSPLQANQLINEL